VVAARSRWRQHFLKGSPSLVPGLTEMPTMTEVGVQLARSVTFTASAGAGVTRS
jgi:hypothetical protein